MHPPKRLIVLTKKQFSSYTKKRKNLQKMKIGKIKADTPEAQPHVIPEVEKTLKSDIGVKKTVHTSIIPYQGLRE